MGNQAENTEKLTPTQARRERRKKCKQAYNSREEKVNASKSEVNQVIVSEAEKKDRQMEKPPQQAAPSFFQQISKTNLSQPQRNANNRHNKRRDAKRLQHELQRPVVEERYHHDPYSMTRNRIIFTRTVTRMNLTLDAKQCMDIKNELAKSARELN